jgi:predicted NAD-dependent protein-ADP-ribosyltransferase YbiA (DUF1768 family)
LRLTPEVAQLLVGISGLLAFYYPGKKSLCDKICNVPFLGNFYPCDITYRDHGYQDICANTAEAVFQAAKFFDEKVRQEIAKLDPESAFKRARKYSATSGDIDVKYRLGLMIDVLMTKFSLKHFFAMLLATGNAFILEHNDVKGRDAKWSDNHDGTGLNLLGLALMLVRYLLAKRYVENGKISISREALNAVLSTKKFLEQFINIETGELCKNYEKIWLQIVASATKSYLIQEQDFLKTPSNKASMHSLVSSQLLLQHSQTASQRCMRESCRQMYRNSSYPYCCKSCCEAACVICGIYDKNHRYPGSPYCSRTCKDKACRRCALKEKYQGSNFCSISCRDKH